MFFGIGAYGVAIASDPARPELAGARRSASPARSSSRSLLSLVIGLFSLRVRGDLLRHDHARRRLGVPTLASQLSDFTGGEDGLTFKVPEALAAGHRIRRRALPRRVDRRPLRHLLPAVRRRRWCWCWRCCGSSTRRSAACCRRSARTTSAPRRSATAPSSTARIASVLSALFATLAGVLLALWLRYNGPDTTLSFEIMLDVLLIVVIGGMGTIYGAVVGSVLLGAGAELPAGPDEARRRRRCRACRCWRRSSRPTAGCSGSASCSCSRSTTCRPASSAACARCARAPAGAESNRCRSSHRSSRRSCSSPAAPRWPTTRSRSRGRQRAG